MSRRNLIAGIGVAGVGAVAAVFKATAGNAAALTGTMPSAFPTTWTPGTASASATASPFAASATSAAGYCGVPTTAGTAAASAVPMATPTPVASRSMPVNPATASASASASATATARARTRIAGSGYTSGASCIGAANGQFASWRGDAVGVAATWSQDGKTWVLDAGGEYSGWKGDLDFAPQYDLGNSFTWSALAAGDYDSRLRSDLQALKARWGSRTSTLYYRFQHEFNGDWYRWSVKGDAPAMRAGWQRMAKVFRGVFGSDQRFQITWSAAAGTTPRGFNDVRDAWPGDDAVDVVSVDYYDFSKIQNAADWSSQLGARDGGGGPLGLGAWREFALAHGKPLSVSEWGNQYGDNPYFIQVMHDFFLKHAYSGSGSAAGKVLYEVYFNQVFDGGNVTSGGDFRVQVDGRDHPSRPNAAQRYRQLFGA